MHIVDYFTIAGAVIGGLVFLGLLFAGVGFFWQSFHTGKNQAEVDDERRKDRVDQTLKDLVDAQEKRYLQLETDHKDNMKEIGKLQGIVQEQAKQQKWFEGIFISALQNFFKENPELAVELSAKLTNNKVS